MTVVPFWPAGPLPKAREFSPVAFSTSRHQGEDYDSNNENRYLDGEETPDLSLRWHRGPISKPGVLPKMKTCRVSRRC